MFWDFFCPIVKYSQTSEFTWVSKGMASPSLGCENDFEKMTNKANTYFDKSLLKNVRGFRI